MHTTLVWPVGMLPSLSTMPWPWNLSVLCPGHAARQWIYAPRAGDIDTGWWGECLAHYVHGMQCSGLLGTCHARHACSSRFSTCYAQHASSDLFGTYHARHACRHGSPLAAVYPCSWHTSLCCSVLMQSAHLSLLQCTHAVGALLSAAVYPRSWRTFLCCSVPMQLAHFSLLQCTHAVGALISAAVQGWEPCPVHACAQRSLPMVNAIEAQPCCSRQPALACTLYLHQSMPADRQHYSAAKALPCHAYEGDRRCAAASQQQGMPCHTAAGDRRCAAACVHLRTQHAARAAAALPRQAPARGWCHLRVPHAPPGAGQSPLIPPKVWVSASANDSGQFGFPMPLQVWWVSASANDLGQIGFLMPPQEWWVSASANDSGPFGFLMPPQVRVRATSYHPRCSSVSCVTPGAGWCLVPAPNTVGGMPAIRTRLHMECTLRALIGDSCRCSLVWVLVPGYLSRCSLM